MSHIYTILFVAAVNRFLRLSLKREEMPKDASTEMKNYGYTVIGVAILYIIFYTAISIVAKIFF